MFHSLWRHAGESNLLHYCCFGWYKSLQGTKKLLQVYKKGEGDAFKSRACGPNTRKVRTAFVVKKRRRKRMSKINVNVLAPKGNYDV